MIFDAHLHLQDIKDGNETSSMLSSLKSNGIGRLLCNATSPDDWNEVNSYSSTSSIVTPYFGVHPWFVNKLPDGWDAKLRDLVISTGSGMMTDQEGWGFSIKD